MSFMITSIVITVITTAATTTEQYMQGQSQKKWSEYNADVQREQAKAVLDQANKEAARKRAQGETLMARQRVLYAKSGLDLSGTPTEVMLGTADEVEQDAQTIIRKGQMGYWQDMQNSSMSETQGEQAAMSGALQAGGTLLSGMGKVAGDLSANYTSGGPLVDNSSYPSPDEL